MYVLRLGECISVPVQVTSVEMVPNAYHDGQELHILASLSLSPNTEPVNVVLWAPTSAAATITIDDEFVSRNVTLEGHCTGDHSNPYNRPSVGISSIWFSDSQLALVKHEVLS
jgi:hypothetical protein